MVLKLVLDIEKVSLVGYIKVHEKILALLLTVQWDHAHDNLFLFSK